jgi:UDP-GlcNAc3NAcA epimerase
LHFSAVSDERSTILSDLNLTPDSYVLVTIHRDSNTDVPENMKQIFTALMFIREKSKLKIVLPIHPRTKSKLEQQLPSDLFSSLTADPGFLIVPPAGFLDIIALEKNAKMIITDSGGLQKEAFFFQKPCIILRPQTEWVEIVENGNAVLADASAERIKTAFEELSSKSNFTYPPLFGDGRAAEFICETLLKELE